MKSTDLAQQSLMKDEGFKQFIYYIGAIRHIGYGFNLDDVGLYKEECDFILTNRIGIAEAELRKSFPNYKSLSIQRQAILINLCYNLGISGLLGFREFIGHTEREEWDLASKELINSLAHSQNPARMERLAYQYEMDKM